MTQISEHQMPYRQAPYYVAVLFVAATLAFWPHYISVFPTASWAFHLHGVTGSLWLLVLATQSWTIHRKRPGIHRIVGIATLFLFPAFLSGSALMVQSIARKMTTSHLYHVFGARLDIVDATSSIVLAWLFYMTMRKRRQARLHASYAMATAILLLMPVLVRLFVAYLPGLTVHSKADFWHFPIDFQLAQLVELICSGWLFVQSGQSGRPYLVLCIAILGQSILFETFGRSNIWRELLAYLATASSMALALTTFSICCAATWLSWFSLQHRRDRMQQGGGRPGATEPLRDNTG